MSVQAHGTDCGPQQRNRCGCYSRTTLLTGQRGGIRRLSARFAVTAVDQCVSSLSNFAVGVAVARLAGIAALGAYSLAYIVWLIVADLHRSLITDPMAIESDLSQPNPTEHVSRGLAAEVSLGLALGSIMAGLGGLLLVCGQHPYGICLIVLAPWLPVLLVQDYWRWVGFMSQAPGRALANDVVFDLGQAAAFGALAMTGSHSSVVAVEAWGFGASAAALFGLWQFSVTPTVKGGVALLKLRWPVSKWLVSSSVTTWGAGQGYLLVAAMMLGPVSLGGLRAALSLVSGPSVVLLQAGGSVGLPEASKALNQQGWPGLRRVQRLVTAAGLVGISIVGLAVLTFGRQLLELLYGRQFVPYAHVADLLVLSVFLGTAASGAVLSLKATRLTRFVSRKSAMSLVVSLVAVALLVPAFGVAGAAWAAVARSATSMVASLAYHWRWSRKAAEASGSAAASPSHQLEGRLA